MQYIDLGADGKGCANKVNNPYLVPLGQFFRFALLRSLSGLLIRPAFALRHDRFASLIRHTSLSLPTAWAMVLIALYTDRQGIKGTKDRLCLFKSLHFLPKFAKVGITYGFGVFIATISLRFAFKIYLTGVTL